MSVHPSTGAAGNFTTRELLQELERELSMRRTVFPRLVRAGKLTQSDADRRIDLLSAIHKRITATAGQF